MVATPSMQNVSESVFICSYSFKKNWFLSSRMSPNEFSWTFNELLVTFIIILVLADLNKLANSFRTLKPLVYRTSK